LRQVLRIRFFRNYTTSYSTDRAHLDVLVEKNFENSKKKFWAFERGPLNVYYIIHSNFDKICLSKLNFDNIVRRSYNFGKNNRLSYNFDNIVRRSCNFGKNFVEVITSAKSVTSARHIYIQGWKQYSG